MNQISLNQLDNAIPETNAPEVEVIKVPSAQHQKEWHLGDRQVKVFSKDEGADFEDYLLFRRNTDIWEHPEINQLAAIPISKAPLLRKKDAEEATFYRHGVSHKLWVPINTEDPKVVECVEEGMFLCAILLEDGIKVFPQRYTAFSSLLQRGGVECPAEYITEKKGKTSPVDIQKKATMFNWAKDVRNAETSVLIRDGKVSYAGSEQYQQLCPYEGLYILLESVREDHPDTGFHSAMVSHEYVFGEYLLNDEEMEESVRLMMEGAGLEIERLRAGIRYSTSEVGTSSMTCKFFIDYKAKKDEKTWTRIQLPKSVKVPHEGKGGMARWKAETKKIGAIFKEAEEQLEALGNITINDVPRCVQAVRNAYPFLPAKETQTVIDSLRLENPAGTGTAMDVFIALNEIVSLALTAENITPTRYISYVEQVQKLITLDYAHIDATGECGKGGK